MTSTATVEDCTTDAPDDLGTAELLDEVVEYLRLSRDPQAVRIVRRAKALRREMVEDRR